MPQEYTVDGRRFVWHGLDDNDERTVDVALPLRLKMGLLRQVSGLSADLDAETMFALLEKIAPDQTAAIDQLDLNDFVAMFDTWHGVYEQQNGATLGEAERSSTSSTSTATPSPTTGAPGSVPQ